MLGFSLNSPPRFITRSTSSFWLNQKMLQGMKKSVRAFSNMPFLMIPHDWLVGLYQSGKVSSWSNKRFSFTYCRVVPLLIKVNHSSLCIVRCWVRLVYVNYWPLISKKCIFEKCLKCVITKDLTTLSGEGLPVSYEGSVPWSSDLCLAGSRDIIFICWYCELVWQIWTSNEKTSPTELVSFTQGLSVCLSSCLPVCVLVCLSSCPSVCLPACLFILNFSYFIYFVSVYESEYCFRGCRNTFCSMVLLHSDK